MSKLSNQHRREFLLGFFNQLVDENEIKNVNGFVLFKHWNGNTNRWTVDIFTPESYRAMKGF